MKMNASVFEKVKSHKANLVAVTKYWDEKKTAEIINFGQTHFPDTFIGIGENRTKAMVQKLSKLKDLGIPKCKCHFIGNIQSRQIKYLRDVDCIHSLCDLDHARKINQLAQDRGQDFDVFLQVKISKDPLKFGLEVSDLEMFLNELQILPFLSLQGISAMGADTFTLQDKIKECQNLIKLRDQYFSRLSVSAGTSRDFEIALGEGIDIVRIGHKLINDGA
ncbi:MAG TPA: alanine racemase [Candidatus Gracilibacteria bacterium]